jgi:hypothetical protein
VLLSNLGLGADSLLMLVMSTLVSWRATVGAGEAVAAAG